MTFILDHYLWRTTCSSSHSFHKADDRSPSTMSSVQQSLWLRFRTPKSHAVPRHDRQHLVAVQRHRPTRRKYMYLAELCVPVADVAGRRQLRSASRRLLNFLRYNMSNSGRRAFCFAGPYVWNSLPEHIRQSTSIAVFKRSLKTFLLQQISHLAH